MTERRRILMTADAVGGVWTYALALAQATAPLGCEYLLAVMGPRPAAAQRSEARRRGNVALAVGDFALEWMPEPWTDVERAGAWLRRLCEDWNPDLVHLNGYAHATIDFGRPVLVAAHSDVLSWHEWARGEPAGAAWEAYHGRLRDAVAAATAVVAPTAAMLRELRRHYGEPGASHVIPNGLDVGAIRHSSGGPVVLGAGRLWDEGKNLSLLAEASERICWPSLVAGEAAPGVRRCGRGLTLLGRIDREALLDHMRFASIFVHPAKYEPFGLAPLEAAASGCALVLGDIPSLREVWRDAALYVPTADPRALADAVNGLIEDAPRRRALARRALERSRSFTLEPFGAAYRGLYDELLAPAPKRAADPAMDGRDARLVRS